MRIIAGKWRRQLLATPTTNHIRPTRDRVRESLFNIIQHHYPENLQQGRVLDLFSGTGALGLEALSRGASYAIFVDNGVEARGLIRENIETLGATGVTRLLRRDATDLGAIGAIQPFDLIFLDPPYGQGLGEKACQSALSGGWLAQNAVIILEEEKNIALNLSSDFVIEDCCHYGQTDLYIVRVQTEEMIK